MTNQSQPGNNNNSTATRHQLNNHWTSSQPLDPLPAPPLPPPPTSKSPASRTTSTSSPSRYDNTLTRPPTSSGSTSSSVSSSNRHLTNHSHNHYPSADHDPSLLYAHQNYSNNNNNNTTNNSNINGGDNNTVRSMSFLKSHHHTNPLQPQGPTTNSASSHSNKHNKQNSIGKGDHYNNGSHHHHHHSHNHSIGHNSNSSSNSNNSSRELPSVQQAVSSIPSMLQLQQLQQQQIQDGSFDYDLQQQQQQQQLHGYIHEGGDNVMMQEWLHKRSSSLQLVWKRRWCVLREDRLFFYRTNTDTKPLGMLHLSEYSILAAGPEISRKSKFAFRLSSPEPIPHQQQHHVFFTESAQSLHNWLYSLQLHINHATATWFSKAATSSATGLGLQQTGGAASGGLSRRMDQAGVVHGQSIIDKVLDRLHLDDPSTSGEPGAPTGSMSDSTIASTVKDQSRLPYIPPNFSQSHEDNNDTWSSTSSMPNTSTNTSTNLEYIFALTQQSQASKSSMDSIRGGNDRSEQQARSQGSPIVSGGASHQPIHPTPLSYATSSTGYAGSTFTDQSSVTSEAIRFSADYQGRSSLHQPRPSPGAGNGFLVGSASPHMYPIRSSVHSGLSAENGAGSPSTSVAGSPFASPTLSSQHPSVLSSNNNNSNNNNNNNNNNNSSNINHHTHSHTGSASPRTFYRVLENSSPSKRAESIASSASISTIASSGDVSTINDLNSENGLSSTATDSSLPSKPKSAGATILGLVTGGSKHKKDKKDGSNAGSNHSGSGSGSGSSGLKLFGSGVCHYSGCTQMAKTCTFHNKKFRPESPNAIASRKAKEEKKAAKETAKEEKKAGKSSLWSSSSDKSGSQGNISEISSPIMMKADGSLLTNYNGGSGRGLSSRSMVSLPRDAEFGIDPSTVPLPPLHLRSLASSPTRRRSPSVSVLEESFSQQSQQQDYSRTPDISSKSNGGYSMRPQTPLSAAPSQPLPPPPPPPRAPSSASNHRPGTNNKETFSLSRKMGLQMGSEFGAVEKTALSGTALDGNYFVANHHRTMQKLQLSRKPQPLQQQQQFIDQQQFQQQQQQQYQQQQSELFKGVGVSRHIVAPDELAMAIEMEAEEMRRRQAELQETQKSRPTSMVKGGGAYHSMPIQLHLATVSESSALSDGADEAESGLQESQSPPRQDGGKIISAQEQMAYAPLELPTAIESDRSPISGFTAGISPLSPNPGSQLPPAASLGIPLSEISNASPGGGRGGSTKPSNHRSPRSNSLSTGSGVSSSGSPSSSGLPAPLSSLSRRQMSSSPGLGSRHPMSPMNASFMEEEDRSDFHMRSLPPPKRRTNDHLFKGDSNSTQRNELPRRSSAAAAVTLSPTENGPRSGPLSNDQHGGPTPSSSSGAPGTSLRPAYMARRQSSSPVLIRVSDQGGQNISPLLTGGATRTFAGDAPSREVIRRPSELTTPMSSAEGSPAPSTSTGSSSICSFVTSRYTEQDAPPMSPSQDGASTSSLPSPTSVPGRVYRTASSPLASVTPADGCSPSTSPAPNSVPQMPEEPINTTHPALTSMTPSSAPHRGPAVVNEDIPSVVINSPRASSSLNVVGQEPTKRVLHNVSSFRFPAPSQDATEMDSNSRPLSSCSSASLYSSASENFGAHEEEDHHTSMDEGYRSRQQQYQQQQHQQQRRGSNGLYHDGTHSPGGGMSPSLHAAALGLYPGLRKLSLFTAAVGDHPPPPLLSGRKDSAGSSVSTRDYHHGVTSPTLSIMEDGDEVTTEEEDLDLHNDEDWAGNMKSMRRGYHQDPSIVVANAAITGEAPGRVVVDSLPMDGLAAPPLIPLPLTPPHSTTQPLRPSPSAMKAPPVIPGSYYFPTSPSVSLPLTPPVSDNIPPVSPSKNPLALAVATQGGGVPPMIPPRSPHRSVPGSPTTLRSMRSYQSLVSPPPPPSGA